MILNKVCEHCGSTYVKHDAWASWDIDAQRWTLDNYYDNAFCEECDGETYVVTVPTDQVITCDACEKDYHDRFMNKTSRGDHLCNECNKKEGV